MSEALPSRELCAQPSRHRWWRSRRVPCEEPFDYLLLGHRRVCRGSVTLSGFVTVSVEVSGLEPPAPTLRTSAPYAFNVSRPRS